MLIIILEVCFRLYFIVCMLIVFCIILEKIVKLWVWHIIFIIAIKYRNRSQGYWFWTCRLLVSLFLWAWIIVSITYFFVLVWIHLFRHILIIIVCVMIFVELFLWNCKTLLFNSWKSLNFLKCHWHYSRHLIFIIIFVWVNNNTNYFLFLLAYLFSIIT
jgi:hypothetical protein